MEYNSPADSINVNEQSGPLNRLTKKKKNGTKANMKHNKISETLKKKVGANDPKPSHKNAQHSKVANKHAIKTNEKTKTNFKIHNKNEPLFNMFNERQFLICQDYSKRKNGYYIAICESLTLIEQHATLKQIQKHYVNVPRARVERFVADNLSCYCI